MNIDLKGTVGDKIAIIGEITQVLIDQSGVTYGVKVEANDEFKWVEDGAGIIAWNQEDKKISVKEEKKDDGRISIPQPKTKPEKVKREKVKTTLPEIPKKRPGRPKKATVEGTMAKLARMKQEETDKALDELEGAREKDAD